MTDISIDGKEILSLDIDFDFLTSTLHISAKTKLGYTITREIELKAARIK